MKLLCLYQVMFQYRVGTYEAMAKLPNVDFELWHGKDVANTKMKNYRGDVSFKHFQLPSLRMPVRTNNGSSTQPYFPFLFFRLIRCNPDVILSEGASNIISLSVAFIYAKIFRKKIVLWSMGALAGREYKGIRSFIQRWLRHLEKKVNALFVYSTQAENYFIKEGVDSKKIFKAINVIDTNTKMMSIKKSSPIEKDPGFNVAFVGAINKTKRLELLIDAVGEISLKYCDVKLHIIVDGAYLQTIKDYVEEERLSDRVVFHGRITEGLNELLAKYHVLALPGLGGLAIVDGMVSSLPIISGLADGTEKDLIDVNNGYVTDNITKAYMVEKLLLLHDSPGLAKKLGENSYRKITEEYSFDNYMKIFNDCLNFVMYEK